MSGDLPPELEPPDHRRRLRLHRFQWVGLPLLVLVPVLALFGVFGRGTGHAEDRSPTLALSVEYPTRFRYKEIGAVEVAVRNATAGALDTLVVAFDPAYVRRFSTPSFIPSPAVPFEVELLDVGPGEVRHVWAELQGERYGRHRGTVAAFRRGGRDTASVVVRTLTFP